MTSALAGVSSWPVGWAAAAIIGPDGVIERVGDDRPVVLASVSKLFVAHALSVALEEGAVGLADRAGPPGSSLAHLLSHCGGYGFDDEQVLAEPGHRRIYSNSGWAAAARHVEESAEMTMAAYLTEAILEPLRLDSTALHGHPGTAVVSTLHDVSRFARELLDPQLVDPVTTERFRQPWFPGLAGVLPGCGRFDPLDWGLGCQLNSSASMPWAATALSATAFGHFGASGTLMWVDPNRQLCLVALTDRQFGPWALEAWPRLGDTVIAEHGN
jgi:CubicO group peptidase (beta-lactamase class C family)